MKKRTYKKSRTGKREAITVVASSKRGKTCFNKEIEIVDANGNILNPSQTHRQLKRLKRKISFMS